jgi:hypothetical protein
VNEEEYVTHKNWREILESSSAKDLERLHEVARLYDDVLGLLDPAWHPKSRIEAARVELGRSAPSGLSSIVPVWDNDECMTLMLLHTGLSRQLCEAFLDMETIRAIEEGGASADEK